MARLIVETTQVNFIKHADDPEGIRISLGRTHDRSLAYLIYRGDLKEVKDLMYILNKFIHEQSNEAPYFPGPEEADQEGA